MAYGERMLHYVVGAAFDDLLYCWRTYQDTVNKTSSSIRERGDARAALDNARNRMHRLRVAVYPNPDEAQGIVHSMWCETLELVVHMRWDHRDSERPGNFRCICGDLVPIDWQIASQ